MSSSSLKTSREVYCCRSLPNIFHIVDEMSESTWRLLGGGDSERVGERGRFGRLCAVDEGR